MSRVFIRGLGVSPELSSQENSLGRDAQATM
jgi:hypothetical protein